MFNISFDIEIAFDDVNRTDCYGFSLSPYFI